MERDTITINKEAVPCTFEILLGDELFNLTVSYNDKYDFFTVALEKDGEMICEGEPIVYGFPLFGKLYQAEKYPCIEIVPWDESGEENTVTFKNLCEVVLLTVDNYEESGETL